LQWFRRAAERGHVQAQYNLGNMYLKGQGVKPDRAQAKQWFTQAAEQGHKGAKKALDAL
jgi:TPR repeat protein